MPVTAKRNTKDSVFRDLFSKPEYLLELYKTIHPENKTVTGDILTSITIENVMTDQMYNDLGFTVRDKLMILVEAQSKWSINIILRAFMYLASSYQKYFRENNFNLSV